MMRSFALLLIALLSGMMLWGCNASSGDAAQTSAALASTADSSVPDGVTVYYMHRTYRCASCLRIEQMAREVVESSFSAELSSGRVRWQTVDYLLHEGLAEKYGLNTSSLVLVTSRGGKEVAYRVLDEAWSLYGQPVMFHDFVAAAIRQELASVN